MKKFKSIFTFTFALAALMIMSSCSEDVPVYEVYEYQGPTENGNLKVYARQDQTYYQGALVKLYLSDIDRNNDDAYATTLTESHGTGATDLWAIFNDLDPQTYYLLVTFNDNGTTLTGRENGGNGLFVPKGTTSSVHIHLQ